MPAKKTQNIALSNHLDKLAKITAWFEDQDEIDIEAGLEKVKEAATLIKESRTRLQDIENEFKEIKKDIEKDLA